MQVTPRQFAIAVGLVLVLIGFLGLVLPIKVGDGISCGNAITGSSLHGDNADLGSQLAITLNGLDTEPTNYGQQCTDGISDRRMWALPVLGIGLIAAIGGAVVRREPSTTDEARQTLPA